MHNCSHDLYAVMPPYSLAVARLQDCHTSTCHDNVSSDLCFVILVTPSLSPHSLPLSLYLSPSISPAHSCFCPPTLSWSRPTSFSPVEVVVEYEYDALHEDELTLRLGDVIRNVRRIEEEGWMEGDLNGKRGLFPDNFVKVI